MVSVRDAFQTGQAVGLRMHHGEHVGEEGSVVFVFFGKVDFTNFGQFQNLFPKSPRPWMLACAQKSRPGWRR